MLSKTEELTAGLMGAVKDVKAGYKGLTGVFMHLMEEHGKVGALIKRLAGSDDLSVREHLYPTIRRELLAHEQGEVEVVYPALAQYQETSAIAASHSREASELEALIAQVDALPYGDIQWEPTFKRLANLVEEHVAQEESDYFPKAQKVLGDERAKALLPQFEAAKRR